MRRLSLAITFTTLPLGSLLATGGCASRAPYVWVDELPTEKLKTSSQPLRAGDKIHVSVQGQETMSGEHVIGSDGSIVLPTLGKTPVMGRSPHEAASYVEQQLSGILVSPQVTIALLESKLARISVIGEVNEPGRYEADPDEGVLGALARAGGLTEFAARSRVFVLRQTPDGLRVRFDYAKLARGDSSSAAFRLRDGDVVVVE